jgi:thymidine phosphorylase
VLERMIEAQGGDPRVVEHPERLPACPDTVTVVSDTSGVVTAIDALQIGLTAVAMGAGRTRADQAVDHAVGIELCCARGQAIERDAPLALLHVRDLGDAEVPAVRLRRAIFIDPEAQPTPPHTRILGAVAPS